MSNPTTQSTGVEFQGSEAEVQLAEQVFGLYRGRGAFFAERAPIRFDVASLVEALAMMGNEVSADDVQAVLDANSHVWAREEVDGAIVYVTTRSGTPPVVEVVDDSDHSLPERFTTPEPPRERPTPPREVAPSSVVEEDEDARGPAIEFPPDSWQAAVAAALREAGQPTGELMMTGAVVEAEAPDTADEAPEVLDVDVEARPEDEITVTELEEEELLGEEPETVVAEQPAVEPEPEEAPVAPETTLEVIDVASATDEELAEAIERTLRDEPGVVRWGDAWMHESNVPTLSKDDLNRIQEILAAESEPVSDYALMRVLHDDLTPGSEEFELLRFGLNYRMSRETSLFEFVGTARQALWLPAGTKVVTSEKLSAAEIGQDYRFLLDYRTPDTELEPGLVEHVLTFYEHYHGVLPYNANFASIMPRPAFNDQRATWLTFESPQTFETFEVELRYPTSTRGGYLIGFEEFFAANLVPGAVLTIEAVRDRETHFIIEYFQISRQDRKLLQFNERRNKFVFQTTTYFCATQDDMLVDDNHFERLGDVEPLPEEVRRHPEKVVAATFERVGTREEVDGKVQYRAHIVDILAAANIERPISEPFLRDILSGGSYPEFIADDSEEDVFIYVAPES